MLSRLLDRLLGRTSAAPPEDVDLEKSESNAVEHLGGFDPQELIEDDEPPAH